MMVAMASVQRVEHASSGQAGPGDSAKWATRLACRVASPRLALDGRRIRMVVIPFVRRSTTRQTPSPTAAWIESFVPRIPSHSQLTLQQPQERRQLINPACPASPGTLHVSIGCIPNITSPPSVSPIHSSSTSLYCTQY